MTYEEKVQQDLDVWVNVLEMYRVDYGTYPEVASIEDAAIMAERERYWLSPSRYDPQGRAYDLRSTRTAFRIAAPRGGTTRERSLGSGAVHATQPRAATPRGAGVSTTVERATAPGGPRAVGNTLLVTKAGNDIVLSWSYVSSTMFNGTSSEDPEFRQVQTHFKDLPAVAPSPDTFTWSNGIGADAAVSLRFFDVSDDAETNKGDPIPPLLPQIDPNDPASNLASLYIGGTGVIRGQNFSVAKEENWICFGGGTCTQPTAATASQLDFKVPPGSVSGKVFVRVGGRTSNVVSATVRLQSVALTTTRTMGFSDQNTSYWIGGRDSGNTPQNSVYRVFYDTINKVWTHQDRGSTVNLVYYTSTKTSRDGWLACGVGSTGYAGQYAQTVDTDQAGSTTVNCANIGTSGNVRGAAADPNPGGVAGRDAFFFAQAAGTYLVKKIGVGSGGCTGILDSDWGGTDWSGRWGTQVGMAVDPTNGDLYLAAAQTSGGPVNSVYKITTGQAVSLVKSGFTSVIGLDIARDGGAGTTDPGFLLVADAGTLGAGTVYSFALDNAAAAPVTVAPATSLRTAVWGQAVFSGDLDPGTPGAANRDVEVHNDDDPVAGRLVPIRGPFLSTVPDADARVWISSPDPAEPPPTGQTSIRPSYPPPPSTTYSTGTVSMVWYDGKDRTTCAWIGDPGKALTGYEPDPSPANAPNCQKPAVGGGPCDNKDPFAASGVGAFVDTNGLSSCKNCGSFATPCVWEFRISQKFSGDTYKIYFSAASTSPPVRFNGATPIYTAWKRVHLERDPMYARGGLLFQDFVPQNPCPGADPDCNKKIKLYAWTNVIDGDDIIVFDKTNTALAGGEQNQIALGGVGGPNGDGSITVTLVNNLQKTYRATDHDGHPTNPTPEFTNVQGGGVGVPSVGLLDANLDSLTQTLEDGFVSPFSAPLGAEPIPYMSSAVFKDLTQVANVCRVDRMCRVWFKNFKLGPATAACPQVNGQSTFDCLPSNHFQVAGASLSAGGLAAGVTDSEVNSSVIFRDEIAPFCTNHGGCTPQQHISVWRHISDHEFVHEYEVNECGNFHDTRAAWCGPPAGGCLNSLAEQRCLMNTDQVPPVGQNDFENRADGINRLCKEDALLGDPLCGNGQGSLRQEDDPK